MKTTLLHIKNKTSPTEWFRGILRPARNIVQGGFYLLVTEDFKVHLKLTWQGTTYQAAPYSVYIHVVSSSYSFIFQYSIFILNL